MSTSTKRRARQRTGPAAVTKPDKTCEVCHVPGDEKTLRNWGTKTLPYYMCPTTADCDERAWGVHQDDAPQPEAGKCAGTITPTGPVFDEDACTKCLSITTDWRVPATGEDGLCDACREGETPAAETTAEETAEVSQ